MQQTPVHELHNEELLGMLPLSSRQLVEMGCSAGALAREFKKRQPACHYTGIEVSAEYAALPLQYVVTAVPKNP